MKLANGIPASIVVNALTPGAAPRTYTVSPQGNMGCLLESELPGHGDINPIAQGNFAWAMQDDLMDGLVDSQHGRFATDKHGINYHYIAQLDEGCDKPDFSHAGHMFIIAYHDCINGGVGGVYRDRCILYIFVGGE